LNPNKATTTATARNKLGLYEKILAVLPVGEFTINELLDALSKAHSSGKFNRFTRTCQVHRMLETRKLLRTCRGGSCCAALYPNAGYDGATHPFAIMAETAEVIFGEPGPICRAGA